MNTTKSRGTAGGGGIEDAVEIFKEEFMSEKMNEICDYCGKIIEIGLNQTHKTIKGKVFCDYECMQNYYLDDIPRDEEFLKR